MDLKFRKEAVKSAASLDTAGNDVPPIFL